MTHGIRNRPLIRDRDWQRYDARRSMLRVDKIAMIVVVVGLAALAGYEYHLALRELFEPINAALRP